MRYKSIISAGVLTTGFLVWFFGPKPEKPEYHTRVPLSPVSALDAETLLKEKEESFSIKPNNEARIIWADDSNHVSTEYVLLYLHGFGACQEEGNPVHMHFAKKYGCNLLLSRLYGHGLTDELPLQDFTVQKYWDDALYHLSIARALGKKVILMGTSTGGTLALQMAALFEDVEAVILLSPNIRVNNPGAFIVNNRWGLQIANMISGTDKMISEHTEDWYGDYWYRQYSMRAVAQMQELLESSMIPAVFEKVHQPLLLLYYYKDEENQDNVVSVDAMLKMFDHLSTPDSLKFKIALPDAGNHVIGCYLRSGDVEGVKSSVEDFAQKVLGL